MTGRRRNSLRRRQRAAAPAQLMRKRKLQLDVVDQQGAHAIHEVVLRILGEIGGIVEDEMTRRMLLRHADCREAADGYIQISQDLVQRALESVPNKVVLYDRDGNQVVDTSSLIPSFCSCGCAISEDISTWL